jgi:hypothetical protein
LDTLAFSLSRHNSSIELPAELPDELLRAPFFWLCHGGIVLPLHRPHVGLYTVLRHGPRSFTIRVGSRDKIVSVSHLEACTEADTIPGSPQRRGLPPGQCTGGPPPSSGSRFLTHWSHQAGLVFRPLVSSPSSSQVPPRDGPGTVFPVVDRFLHALDQRGHSRLNCSDIPHCQRSLPQRLDL